MILFLPFEIAHFIQAIVEQYAVVLLPAVFIGYFGLGILASIRNDQFRTAFITITLCCLLISSLLALSVYPFIHMQRYSTPADQTGGGYEIRVADESNNEIWLDRVAMKPMDSRLSHFTEQMATSSDQDRLISDAEMVLKNTAEYRSNGYRNPLSFPTTGAGGNWDEKQLEGYSEFETVRIYSTEYEYDPDSYLDRQVSETCIVEIEPATETVVRGC